MPQIAQSPPLVRIGLRPVLGVVALAVIAYLLGVGFGPLNGFMARWAVLVLELGGAAACTLRAVLVMEERWAWALLALAVTTWAVGDAVWRSLYYTAAEPPA